MNESNSRVDGSVIWKGMQDGKQCRVSWGSEFEIMGWDDMEGDGLG